MGNSLHNKIRLGRASPLASRKLVAVLALSGAVLLSWFILNAMR